MTFCNEWGIQYANNNHMSVWHWSDLISCIMIYTDIKMKNYNVREGIILCDGILSKVDNTWEEHSEAELKYVNEVSFLLDVKIV